MEELFSPPYNFAAIPDAGSGQETSKVFLLPVPYDSTTSYRSGAREGPQAIISASQALEFYDIELKREIYQIGIHTLPELEPAMGAPEKMIKRVRLAAETLLDRGKFVVMLGGEHSLSLGMVQACRGKHPDLSVLQLDAHADLRNEYWGTRYSHACVMRRVVEFCPIVQVGVRSLSLEECRFIEERELQPFYYDDFSIRLDYLDEVVSALNEEVYVTIDLDVFDPSLMPAVGTPEPGGMSWHEVLSVLRAVARKRRIVGFDLVELCPKAGPEACSFLAAKLAYKLIGYVFYSHGALGKSTAVGQSVLTSSGQGKVLSVNSLKETAMIELEGQTRVELPLNELEYKPDPASKSKRRRGQKRKRTSN